VGINSDVFCGGIYHFDGAKPAGKIENLFNNIFKSALSSLKLFY
jgi:hypothetical protein